VIVGVAYLEASDGALAAAALPQVVADEVGGQTEQPGPGVGAAEVVGPSPVEGQPSARDRQ